jgi:hypothetical protein
MKKLLEEFERVTQEIHIKRQLKAMTKEFQRNQTKCEKLLELHKNFSKKNGLDKGKTSTNKVKM